MFVCPALVESGEWLWNHEMRCRLQTLASADLAEIRMKLLSPGSSVNAIVDWMKTLQLQRRRLAEATIRQATIRLQADSRAARSFRRDGLG